MKAIVYTKYGPPDVLQLMDVAKPEPKEDQVLVKVHAASVNALDYRRFEKISAMGCLMEERFIKTINKVLGADIAGRFEAVARTKNSSSPAMRYSALPQGQKVVFPNTRVLLKII